MTDETVETTIRNYIVENILFGADEERLDEQSPLLEWGVLNSLQILALIEFLEGKFEIETAHDDQRPENFASISAIAAFVRSRLAT